MHVKHPRKRSREPRRYAALRVLTFHGLQRRSHCGRFPPHPGTLLPNDRPVIQHSLCPDPSRYPSRAIRSGFPAPDLLQQAKTALLSGPLFRFFVRQAPAYRSLFLLPQCVSSSANITGAAAAVHPIQRFFSTSCQLALRRISAFSPRNTVPASSSPVS